MNHAKRRSMCSTHRPMEPLNPVDKGLRSRKLRELGLVDSLL
jgi:hypothetical protein